MTDQYKDAFQVSLLDAYMMHCREEKAKKEKQKSVRRLHARRSIEIYFENKRLEKELEDNWGMTG